MQKEQARKRFETSAVVFGLNFGKCEAIKKYQTPEDAVAGKYSEPWVCKFVVEPDVIGPRGAP